MTPMVKCDYCHGEGVETGSVTPYGTQTFDCPVCEGEGMVDRTTGTPAVFTVRVWPEDDHVVVVCDVGIFRAPTVPEVLRDVASAYQIAEEARRV